MLLFHSKAYSSSGQQTYNNDSFLKLDSENKEYGSFLVCDGSGRSNTAGLVAKIVCESFGFYLKSYQTEIQDESLLNRALKATEEHLDLVLTHEKATTSGATTLSYLGLNQNGAFIAWGGDSRIYLIRNGTINFKSKDHNLYNEMLNSESFSLEEIENHPNRKMLLNSISGSKDPAYLSYSAIRDIREEDFFLLCSDGFLEAVTDREIEILLDSRKNLEEVKAQLIKECEQKSKDNFTFILIKVELKSV